MPSAVCSQFELRDGSKVDYRHWPARAASRKAVYFFHRGHEHSGRFNDVVELWRRLDDSFTNVHFFSWDMRGHGERGKQAEPASSVAQLVADADELIRYFNRQYEIDLHQSVAIAHSIGGVVASAWIHDYAPKVKAVVLVTPAFRVKLYVPLAIPGLRLLKRLNGDATVTSYVKPTMLTHDPIQAERYAVDPLIATSVSVRLLIDLHDTSKRIVEDAEAMTTPTLLLTAGADWVVANSATERFYQRLGSPLKQYTCFEGQYHDLMHEAESDKVLGSIIDFLNSESLSQHRTVNKKDSDKRGGSSLRHQRLKTRLPLWSPRRWYFNGLRYVIGTIGRTSTGMNLGWKNGFNSGAMLDHVYENQARGGLVIGKLADRIFLNAPGWVGIRQRQQHMKLVLDQLISEYLQSQERVHLTDVACGGGRYVLDAMLRWKECELSATLCDFSPLSLDQAKKLAKQHSLENIEFTEADAFDESRLCQLPASSDIAIGSGLLELFPDNSLALQALRRLAQLVRPGGSLIYTNQPWHPQQELIARSLHGFDRRPWTMRCRSSQEIDQLVESVGFEKTDMMIDDKGIFTVSVAKRMEHE